jgi:glucose-1-phosphate cytidylyltransferase
MVEVGGRPLLWHIMKIYAHHGFTDFVICLGYKGDMIKSYFLNFDYLQGDVTITLGSRESIKCHDKGDEYGWTVTLANTGLNNETGSRIKQTERHLADSDLILLTYGDGVADVNIAQLVEFHKSHGKLGTVTGVSPPSRFGELMLDGNRVGVFSEKPQVSSGLINGGFFVFDRRIFSYVDENPSCNFERDVLPAVSADGQLMCYEHKGFWQCLDTMRDLNQLAGLWQTGKPPWVVWQ